MSQVNYKSWWFVREKESASQAPSIQVLELGLTLYVAGYFSCSSGPSPEFFGK